MQGSGVYKQCQLEPTTSKYLKWFKYNWSISARCVKQCSCVQQRWAPCCTIHFGKTHGSFEIRGDCVASKTDEGLAAHSIGLDTLTLIPLALVKPLTNTTHSECIHCMSPLYWATWYTVAFPAWPVVSAVVVDITRINYWAQCHNLIETAQCLWYHLSDCDAKWLGREQFVKRLCI